MVSGPVGAIEQHNVANPRRRKRRARPVPAIGVGAARPTQRSTPAPQPPRQHLQEERAPAAGSSTTTTKSNRAQLPAAARRSLRQKRQNPRYNQHHYAGLTYRKACKGPDKTVWEKAACEEFHRLFVETSTMKIIRFEDMGEGRKPSYYNPQTRIKVKGDGTKEFRVRGTYGGNISDYLGPKSGS